MKKTIFRVGTRKSPLAIFQANSVKKLIEKEGFQVEMVGIPSEGDADVASELHQMNSIGVFTSALNKKVLSGEIDLAVHSLKDLPTKLEKGIKLAAVVGEREKRDALITHKKFNFQNYEQTFVLATGSQRRKSQWLNKYPNSEVLPLRGNIETRIEKLKRGVDGIIIAKTALDRLKIKPPMVYDLDFVTAPGQGLIGITATEGSDVNTLLKSINNEEMMNVASAERLFMKHLEGGCSAPIGAECHKNGNMYHFFGEVLTLDGKKKVSFSGTFGEEDDKNEFIETLINAPNKTEANDIIRDIKAQTRIGG